MDDLKRWNKITDPTTLQYGDTIVIYAPGAAPKDKSGKPSPGKTKTSTAQRADPHRHHDRAQGRQLLLHRPLLRHP